MAIKTTAQWFGINNTEPEYRLAAGWLSDAVNMDVTKTGALVTRPGYVKKSDGAFTGAFATADESRLYVSKADGVYSVQHGATSVVKVASLTGSGRIYWSDVNGQVFFSNGKDSGIIQPDGEVLQWKLSPPPSPLISATTGPLQAGQYGVCCTHRFPDGRESAASTPAYITASEGCALRVSGIPVVPWADTLVYVCPADSTSFQLAGVLRGMGDGEVFTWAASEDSLADGLITLGMDSLPDGCGPIAFSGGRMCAGQHLSDSKQSVVWMSEPLAYHLFDLQASFFIVPGEIRALASVGGLLIAATESEVYAYSHDDSLRKLADFGVPHGQTHATKDGVLYLWTNRGAASISSDGAMSLLTKNHFYPVSGLVANVAIVESDGQSKFIAAVDSGGRAFNTNT